MDPRTREETFWAEAGGQEVETPIARKREEQFIAKAGGESIETPIARTRKERLIDQVQSGGGGEITLETLNVSENGTVNAPSGKAYKKVVASVSNTYAASDEGKVVSNGALASQTSDTVTANDTYDTTLINSLTVNVSSPVTSVNGQTGAVVLVADDVGASPAETVVEVTSTTPTITPAANTVYNCGELDGLTISNPPATGAYSIVFTSGATATTTTIPATILGLEDFAADANTIYEINVLDNRAIVGSWPVPEVSA